MSAEKTRKREIGSLEAGMRFTKLDAGTIVTLHERAEIKTSAGVITVAPAWQWCLT